MERAERRSMYPQNINRAPIRHQGMYKRRKKKGVYNRTSPETRACLLNNKPPLEVADGRIEGHTWGGDRTTPGSIAIDNPRA